MDNLRFEMQNINFPQINSGGAGTFVLFDLLAPGTGLIAGAAVNQNPGILSGIQNWFSNIGGGGGANKDAAKPGATAAASNLNLYIIAGVIVLIIVIGVVIWKRRQKN